MHHPIRADDMIVTWHFPSPSRARARVNGKKIELDFRLGQGWAIRVDKIQVGMAETLALAQARSEKTCRAANTVKAA